MAAPFSRMERSVQRSKKKRIMEMHVSNTEEERIPSAPTPMMRMTDELSS
jgi:hypothetical protein